MHSLLEISGQDIGNLSDSHLRELIGMLCEAEYKSSGLSTKGILWGGDQNAADGGFDVYIETEKCPFPRGYVPSPLTAFQVKVTDMTPSKVTKEMSPKNELRTTIRSLIEKGGTYIIVSSGASTSYSSHEARIKAMKAVFAETPTIRSPKIEFYDSSQIASWVRQFPPMILWVRNRIGKNLIGWYPYGNWSKSPEGISDMYLLDEKAKFFDRTKANNEGISITDGIQVIRTTLATPRNSVRLVGLSGVGKTRFVEALFDKRIGNNSLDPHEVLYTDISFSPNPNPMLLVEQLIACNASAIVVVDNCPQDLHRMLTDLCMNNESKISVITIEYDIRDDLPDETDVFSLEPASDKLIENLIRVRFLNLGQVDSNTIAKMSGGNARIAIAIAKSIRNGESVSNLRDDELFDRLFRQKKGDSEHLKASAEVLSLVYSFDGLDTGKNSELSILSSLISSNANKLYGDVAELHSRDLIQSRGSWRAVLPQAMADRLARGGLRKIPMKHIDTTFRQSDSNRLLKSFSRRLSCLHDSPEALVIANEWLKEGGWLGNAGSFDKFQLEVFENIAPLSPTKTLEVIERSTSSSSNFANGSNSYSIAKLLRSLAYDPELFDRSVHILCQFALTEEIEERNNSIREILKSLFFIVLSGTNARPEQRLNIIHELIDSGKVDRAELALSIIDTSLESSHVSSMFGFAFGARSRDYGYYPKNDNEVKEWFTMFTQYCLNIALSNSPFSNRARKLLSRRFRGLWTNAKIYDKLEAIAIKLNEAKPWNDGWIAVREGLQFGKEKMEQESISRLKELSKVLYPTDIANLARAIVFSKNFPMFSLEDEESGGITEKSISDKMEEINQKAFQIGVSISQDNSALTEILPEAVSPERGHSRLYPFGEGLAHGCTNKQYMWDILLGETMRVNEDKLNVAVLIGFLTHFAKHDPHFYHKTLDSILYDPVLGKNILDFETAKPIDKQGLDRLFKALDLGLAPIHKYEYLAWGKCHTSISDQDLVSLLKRILKVEGGISVAVEVLSIRLLPVDEEKVEFDGMLKQLGQEVLLQIHYDDLKGYDYNQLDFSLARIVKGCLTGGDEGMNTAYFVCTKVFNTMKDHHSTSFSFPELLKSLAYVQPLKFLDAVFANSISSDSDDYISPLSNSHERQDNPINQIDDEVLIEWCEASPSDRYEFLSSEMNTYRKTVSDNQYDWLPVVHKMLEKAPNIEKLLPKLYDSIFPTFWVNSMSSMLEQRLVLFTRLYEYSNPVIVWWAKESNERLTNAISAEKISEKERFRENHQRFE